MYHFNSIFIIFVYFFLGSLLIKQSLSKSDVLVSKPKKHITKSSESVFTDVWYYQKILDTPQFSLNASELIVKDGNVLAKNPIGKQYTSKKKHVRYSANKAFFVKKKKELSLTGNVKIHNQQIDMKCFSGFVYINKKQATCKKNVRTKVSDLKNGDKLFVNSKFVKIWWDQDRLEYTGQVKGRIKRKYDFEPGLKFSSNKLLVFKKDLKAEFEGSVFFESKGVKSWAQRADLFMDNYNKKLKYYILYDDIKVEQKIPQVEGGFITRLAHSEILEAFNRERKIVLKGAPRVSQGQDTTRGYKITLFLDREIMEVDNASSVIKIRK